MNSKKEQRPEKKGIKSHTAGKNNKSIPGDKILKMSPVTKKKSESKIGIITAGHTVQIAWKCRAMQGPKGRIYSSRPNYKLCIEEIKEKQTEEGSSEKRRGVRETDTQILLHKRNPVPDRPRPVTGKPRPQSDYKQGSQDRTKKENET